MLNRWFRLSLLQIVYNHLIKYPTPQNLSYFYGFGSLSGICLVIQIITGIFLAMHYTAHVDFSFSSVEHIMRDVNNGWILRYFHANGASMFFLVVYMHMGRSIYYISYIYPRMHTWSSGVTIFILMMATAFLGYVLPWGQMSFWGATVITNLFTALPAIGATMVQWIWGGFSVDNPTLNRFYSLHFTLPFIIAALVMVHLAALHLKGSTEPLLGGGSSKEDNSRITFYPYFYVKDLYGFGVFFLIFCYFVFYNPNILGHSDNYIEANAMVTPTHIVPEWYFLPFYAMLRSISNKLGGVLCMGVSLIFLYLLPFINLKISISTKFRWFYILLCGFFISVFLLLGWVGSQSVEPLYVRLGLNGTSYYFLFLLLLVPLINYIEWKLIQNYTTRFLNYFLIIKKTSFYPYF